MSYEPENPTSDIPDDAQAWLFREFTNLQRESLGLQQQIDNLDTGLLVYGANIPGTGNVWDDLNAANFTGEEYAGVDGCASTALSIKENALVTFGHNLISYVWQGPQGVCVGLGGTYTAVSTDLSPLGTGDHTALANRNAADSHPQTAVGGRGGTSDLQADQFEQDQNLSNHIANTSNPHTVRHDQLPDVDVDPANPHSQYQLKLPGMFLGGTVSSFTLNTTDSKLINYTLGAQIHWPDDNDVDQIAGEITIPQNGIYRFTAQVIGTQGNDNKEEEITLKLNISGGPSPDRINIDYWEVATDKTRNRSLKTTFTRPAYAGEVYSLWMHATTGLGTWTTELCTFEITQYALIDELIP